MKWEQKARIMRVCAGVPYGDKLYHVLQKTFGRLQANPMARIPSQIDMAQWLLAAGKQIEGRTFFEVGTGHKPIVPIGFFLAGAAEVITVDLNRRLDIHLTKELLDWFVNNREIVESSYSSVVDTTILKQRLDMIQEYRSDPLAFFSKAKIQYLAPSDAAKTQLPSKSIDCHFSVTTLEHINPTAMRAIFVEAHRILSDDGVTLHRVDPSDHFQHQDHSITRINFLRFTEAQWQQLAGNEFAYCNRLRVSDYLRLFGKLGYNVLRLEAHIDPESLALLDRGFPLDTHYTSYDKDDLCSTSFRIMMNKAEAKFTAL